MLIDGRGLLVQRRIQPLHSQYFDMWRGISAAVVVIGHIFQTFSSEFPAVLRLLFGSLAGAAVMAFFALSGFFIHKSLARCSSDSVNWRLFVRARVERILLPFLACLALAIVLWLVAPLFFASGSREFVAATAERTGYSLSGLWQTAIFLNGFAGDTLSSNGPLWSLSFEVWYYALACLFLMALTSQRVGWIAVPILIGLTLLNHWFFILGLIWLGGFFASILHARDQLPKSPKFPAWPLLAVLLIVILLVPSALSGKLSAAFRIAFGIWMIAHIIYILNRKMVPKLPFLTWLGGFSYSLYVFHFPIFLFAYGISDSAISALVAFLCAFLFSATVGRWIEGLLLHKKAGAGKKSNDIAAVSN